LEFRRLNTQQRFSTIKAKFHYAIWSQTASKLVRGQLRTLLRSASNQIRTCLRPDSVGLMEFGFEPVCDQVRAGSSYLDISR